MNTVRPALRRCPDSIQGVSWFRIVWAVLFILWLTWGAFAFLEPRTHEHWLIAPTYHWACGGVFVALLLFPWALVHRAARHGWTIRINPLRVALAVLLVLWLLWGTASIVQWMRVDAWVATQPEGWIGDVRFDLDDPYRNAETNIAVWLLLGMVVVVFGLLNRLWRWLKTVADHHP